MHKQTNNIIYNISRSEHIAVQVIWKIVCVRYMFKGNMTSNHYALTC